MLTSQTYIQTHQMLAAIAAHQVETCDRKPMIRLATAIESIDGLAPVATYLKECAAGLAPFDDATGMIMVLDQAKAAAIAAA